MRGVGDGVKQVFFRNLIGVIKDSAAFGRWTPVQICLISSRYDNYEVLPGNVTYFTYGWYAVNRVLAYLGGLRAWYKEYTPEDLHAAAEQP